MVIGRMMEQSQSSNPPPSAKTKAQAADVPESFICPINHQIMEYPYMTKAGNTYEYFAIHSWLKNHDTDPLSGMALVSKAITPNNIMRSQILAWFEETPTRAALRTPAIKPPTDMSTDGDETATVCNILRYHGKEEIEDQKKAKSMKVEVPQALRAFGHIYQFAPSPDGDKLLISCDGGKWIEAPDKAMFPMRNGLVFYDPTETRETKVMPGAEVGGAQLCKYGKLCKNDSCSDVHAFVCAEGVACKGARTSGRCKFLHPQQTSVVPLGREYPLNKECKYKTDCTNKTCCFAHPNGRMAVPRAPAQVFITHSLTLDELPAPIAVELEIPEEATCFQFQGEFVFFFEPFPGTWAKEHYKNVMVHRFDPARAAHKPLGVYSLDKHYCNCVVGAGRYFIISFWPYEEEAIRTIWECLKVGRVMEKELRSKTKELEALKREASGKDTEISRLEALIIRKDGEISQCQAEIARLNQVVRTKSAQILAAAQDARAAKAAAHNAEAGRKAALQEARTARSAAAAARKELRDSEAMWRRQRQNQERAQLERLRMRDPIHIYALAASGRGGGGGCRKEDWVLLLDYHKGAHDIKLGQAEAADGSQALHITEHQTVFRFDLVAPGDLSALRAAGLPVAPGKLCADF